jgi:hypothetical protein
LQLKKKTQLRLLLSSFLFRIVIAMTIHLAEGAVSKAAITWFDCSRTSWFWLQQERVDEQAKESAVGGKRHQKGTPLGTTCA